jgi:putative transposase
MDTANTVRIDPTQRSGTILRVIGDRVSRLWNAANYRCRQNFIAKKGVPTGSRLEDLMKDEPEYRQLPSDIAQEVLKKLSEAWTSYFELRAKWCEAPDKNQKPGLPRYRKDRKSGERPFDLIPVKHPRSYAIDAKDISLVLPCDLRNRHKTAGRKRLFISYRGRVRHIGKMGRAEVIWDTVRRRWYFAWYVKAAEVKSPGNLSAAIDLGVRILDSLSIEGQEMALHFCGRDVLKDWDYFGREIAREQACIANTRGKDPEKCPSSRAISLLHRKRKGRLEHALRVIAKEVADTCAKAGVGAVYLGWPKDILRDRDYGSKWNGRIHNFWSFDRSLKILECAFRAVGIVPVRVGERGTSSTCCRCDSKNVVRHPRWALRCRDCGERIHSDQAGSRNILRQNKPSVCCDGAEAAPRTVTRRWTLHRWENRSANPKRLAGNDVPEFLKVA